MLTQSQLKNKQQKTHFLNNIYKIIQNNTKTQMNLQFDQHRISSSSVQSLIFILPLDQVLAHLIEFKPSTYSVPAGKIIHICYLVVTKDMSYFTKMQRNMRKMQHSSLYNVTIVPFNFRKQIQQHVAMMEKMNGSQFQSEYVQMLDLLEKDIEFEIIQNYCHRQLKWSENRINQLINKENINSIANLLNYRGFNALEMIKIKNLWQFLQKYIAKH